MKEELDEEEFEFGGEQSEEAGNPEELDEADEPEDPQESEEPDEADEADEPEEPESVEPVEERPKAEPTVKPESKTDSLEESPPGNSFHRDNPARHESSKPSILDGLRNYTPPARVAAPPDRKRQGVML